MLLNNINVGVYIGAILVIAISHWIYKWKNPKCNGKLPPGSLGLPYIGETIQLFIHSKSLDIPPFFKSRAKKYGPVFKTSLVGRPVVVSTDAEFSHFIMSQEGKLVELWYMDAFESLMEQQGSFKDGMSSSGHMHKYIKKIIAEYMGNEALKSKVLTQLEDTIKVTLLGWSKMNSVEVKSGISKMILDVTANILFGYDPNTKEDLYEPMAYFIKGLLSFPFKIPGTAYYRSMKTKDKILKIIREAIEEKKAGKPGAYRGDFLDQLIEDSKNDKTLTEGLITYLLFAILLAAFETVPINLTLVLKLVTDHPNVILETQKENEEIIRKRENKEAGTTWHEYKSMTFTMNVINESLRIGGGSGGILRKALEDIHINGYTIPKGWGVLMSPFALHLNPEKYKDPLTYNPWRWKDMGSNFSAKHFIPFGGGMRSCPGSDYSRVLMALFFHVLVTNYRWTVVKGGQVVRTPLLGFTNGYHIKLQV